MTIFFVTVGITYPLESDYRIAAPTEKKAQEAAIEMFKEDIRDYCRFNVDSCKAIDQQAEPDRIVHDEED